MLPLVLQYVVDGEINGFPAVVAGGALAPRSTCDPLPGHACDNARHSQADDEQPEPCDDEAELPDRAEGEHGQILRTTGRLSQ